MGASNKGKCVIGVKAGKDLDDPKLPRWLGKEPHLRSIGECATARLHEAIEWRKLVNDLNTTPKIERVPFMAGRSGRRLRSPTGDEEFRPR